MKRKDAKGAENAKVFIVVIVFEPQRRRDAEFYWGSGIGGQKAGDKSDTGWPTLNLELLADG